MSLSRMVPFDSPVLTTRWGAKAALASNLINRSLARHLGHRLGYFLISEYPKSGGTWFGKMAAEAIQIPYPEHSVFPIGCPSVIHNHWRFDRRFRRCWYVCRDGRDSVVSLYFHRMRDIADPSKPAGRRFESYYRRLYGPSFDPANIIENLPRFIENEYRHPQQSFGANWADHVRGWIGPDVDASRVKVVTYESLLDDACEVLGDAVAWACGREADPWVISTTVDKNSMLRMTGRKPGEEDRGNFIRKGVAGDWRNHFSREAAEVFDSLAGDVLVHLGYESDRDWASRHAGPGAVAP
jgi:hypothetical protein